MKKVLFVLFFSISAITFAQESKFWDNVRFGGGFGLSFGNTTTIAVSPSAIYDFESGFSLGAGLNYTYSERGATNNANVYGASIISMYNVPVVNLQLSGEFEQLLVNRKIDNTKTSYGVPAMYLGLAYRTRFASFGFRYDVLHNETRSIYSSPISPIVRIFF